MQVAITGGSGFLGRYIVHELVESGHRCRCWHRPTSDCGGFDEVTHGIEWIPGDLTDADSIQSLLHGADAVVHTALYRPGEGFRGREGDLPTFVDRNVLGSIRLIDAAHKLAVNRFLFISTCSVHEVVLSDRKLDESHPMWPMSHYGAHKAAIEEFVYSYGLGHGYNICALRPTGIYGLARPAQKSKWFDIVHRIARGEDFASERGGKEVHASDVARAVRILLTADGIAGQAYSCYDRYIAEQDVALMAKRITNSGSKIELLNKGPKNQIDTSKIRSLGMKFGGEPLLEETISELLLQPAKE